MFLYYISRAFVLFKISVLRTTVLENFGIRHWARSAANVLLHFIFNDVLLYKFNYQCFVNKVYVVVASAAMIFLFKMKTNVSRTLHFYQKLTLSSVGTATSSCLLGKNKRFCLIQTTDLVI